MTAIIYMDDAATTMIDPAVREAMLPWLARPANPHIRHHSFGSEAAAAISKARTQIATAINADAEDIIFTSGATEANNLFINGLAAHLHATGKTHIITSAVEHSAILAPLAALPGFSVTILPTKPCGMIEAKAIAAAITPQTGLVTIQAVNNVTGTIQPLSEIAAVLENRDIIFHSDAAQALGKINFDMKECGADAVSLCAHKIYGPAGIGALAVKPHIRKLLSPTMFGGGQENGVRPGTLPTMLCVGFGEACARITDERARLQELRALFIEKIEQHKPEIFGHSDPLWNVPGILCLRFKGIDHETLLMTLPAIAFSIGSACGARGGTQHNHVITALSGTEAAAETIRLSFGRFTSRDDIEQAAIMFDEAITTIRKIQEAA